jgi:hypothetical protein
MLEADSLRGMARSVAVKLDRTGLIGMRPLDLEIQGQHRLALHQFWGCGCKKWAQAQFGFHGVFLCRRGTRVTSLSLPENPGRVANEIRFSLAIHA